MAIKSVSNQKGFEKGDAAKFYTGSTLLGAGVIGLGLLLRKNGVEYAGLMIAAGSFGGMAGAYLKYRRDLKREQRSSEAMCRRVVDARVLENYGQDPNSTEKRILRS